MQRLQDREKAEGRGRERELAFNLPPELVFHIFSFLTVKELLEVALVSTSWRDTVDDSYVWHRHFERLLSRFERVRGKPMLRERKLANVHGYKARYHTLTCLEWDPVGCKSSIKVRNSGTTVVSKKDQWESVRMGRPILAGGRYMFRLRLQLKSLRNGSGKGMPGGVIFGFSNQKTVTPDCMRINSKKHSEVEAFYYEDYPHPIWRDEPVSYFRKKSSWNLERQHVACFRIRDDSTVAKDEVIVILDLPCCCCYQHGKSEPTYHRPIGRKAIEVITYHRSFTIEHVDLLSSRPVYFTITLRNAKATLLPIPPSLSTINSAHPIHPLGC